MVKIYPIPIVEDERIVAKDIRHVLETTGYLVYAIIAKSGSI